jgi:hypothetical protein
LEIPVKDARLSEKGTFDPPHQGKTGLKHPRSLVVAE